jgi:hypothetical protein
LKELRLRRETLAWREVEGHVVALDELGSQYFATNSSGSLLWEALAKGTTRDALVAKLVESYAIEPERAAADVDAFLAALSANGLLEA